MYFSFLIATPRLPGGLKSLTTQHQQCSQQVGPCPRASKVIPPLKSGRTPKLHRVDLFCTSLCFIFHGKYISRDLPNLNKITEPQQASFYFFLILFIYFYFWLCWVFIAVHGLSLVVVSGGYSSLRCMGFSLRWLLLLWRMGSRCTGFSSCGAQA